MRGKQNLSTPDIARYKRLAEAVLIQAIKDATHERQHKRPKRLLSRSAVRDRERLANDSDKASFFLLTDAHVFPFWCEVAELKPEVVREQLNVKLKRRSTYVLIRRQVKDDAREPHEC